MDIIAIIAAELKLRPAQVGTVARLLDEVTRSRSWPATVRK